MHMGLNCFLPPTLNPIPSFSYFCIFCINFNSWYHQIQWQITYFNVKYYKIPRHYRYMKMYVPQSLKHHPTHRSTETNSDKSFWNECQTESINHYKKRFFRKEVLSYRKSQLCIIVASYCRGRKMGLICASPPGMTLKNVWPYWPRGKMCSSAWDGPWITRSVSQTTLCTQFYSRH